MLLHFLISFLLLFEPQIELKSFFLFSETFFLLSKAEKESFPALISLGFFSLNLMEDFSYFYQEKPINSTREQKVLLHLTMKMIHYYYLHSK